MMRLFMVDFEYMSAWDVTENKEQVLAERIAERIGQLSKVGIMLDLNKDNIQNLTTVVLNQNQLLDLQVMGVVIKIKQEIDLGDDGFTSTLNKFNKMAERLLMMPAIDRSYNEKCEVHMPGQALATYNETLLLTDSCSDSLQTSLDSGWRIIAACPQPDQRRPDYILGRYNPNREYIDHGSAKRTP